MNKVTTFGEVMLRLSPSDNGERITQAMSFRVEPGGSESNVAIALSSLGLESSFITRLPENALSVKIIQYLQQFNIDTSNIIISGEKLGIYWTENGSGPRNSFVIYDRDNTSFSEASVEDYNWRKIFSNSGWFHFSGVSPAISENVFNILQDAVANANIPYSVDLNYRSKLWGWLGKKQSLIREKMLALCEHATLIAGNENDFHDVLGIRPDLKSGNEVFEVIAEKCFEMFPDLKYISISNRQSISASKNIWNGFLFVRGSVNSKYMGVEYTLESIQDRVGTGDSFVAGIIYGLVNMSKYSFQEIINFATTLSALNHTTKGDASRFSAQEIWSVIENNGTGRIIR